MQAVQGIIETVSAKPWQDRRTGQNIQLYSFLVGGKWYRTGQSPIPFGKGQSVKFVANGQNVDVQTIEATQSTVSTAPVAAPSANGYARNTTSGAKLNASKDEYWANKEARDLEKEARFKAVNEPRMAMSVAVEAASRAVVAAMQTDALSFGNTAKSKRLPMIADYIKELATDLAFFIQDAPNTLALPKEEAEYDLSETYVGAEQDQ